MIGISFLIGIVVWITARTIFGSSAFAFRSIAALLLCSALVACKPQEIAAACTPLPIVDGYETAMTEGGQDAIAGASACGRA